jgi:hypothetical protein
MRYQNLGVDLGSRMIISGLNPRSSGLLEPRASFTYRFLPRASFKGGWGIYIQELTTLIDENEIISLFEPWIIIPEYLKPSSAVHYTAGVDVDLQSNLSLSMEVYLKKLKNLPMLNEKKYFKSDPDLISGEGESYGYEFLMKYNLDWLNLTASYTLSWAFKELDNYVYYPKYDTRNSANITTEFLFGSGWSTSAVWSYSSGLPFTELLGFYDKYYINNFYNPWYSIGVFHPYSLIGDRNLGRLPEYHRLDLGVTKKISISPFNTELSLNLVNVYNRENIFYFERDSGKRINMLPLLLTGTIKIEI